MVRVVVTCVPQTGHVLPLLPLLDAFAAAGDEVVLGSATEVADLIAGHDVTLAPVGPGIGDWFGALQGRTRGTPGDGLPPHRIAHYFIPRLFGEVGMAATVDGLLGLCRQLRPDLIVHDPLLFAGPLAGAVLGIPTVHHTIGPVQAPEVMDLVTDAVSPVWREFGLEVPPAAGVYAGRTVATWPAVLDPAVDALGAVVPLRATAPPVACVRPAWLRDRPDHPVVYVTLGTFSNDLEVFRLVLAALAAQPVTVVATVGRDHDPGQLEPLPPNAVVQRFVPQAQLLPHCAAVVHHAGAGTAMGALAHGLPAVALPRSADNFVIADRLAAAGVARVLGPEELDAEAVAAAVTAVLDDSGYADRARVVAGKIAAMPAPEEVAAQLRAAIGAAG